MRSSSKKSKKSSSTKKKSATHKPASLAHSLPEPPDDLVKACLANECVLYAGAGLSNQAGLPTWRTQISDILEWAIKNGYVEKRFAGPLREAIRFGDLDSVADSIISGLGTNVAALSDYLLKRYVSPKGRLPEAHRVLHKIPFSAVLTTNYDDLLGRTFSEEAASRIYTPQHTEQLLTVLSKREFFTLKLYGALEQPDSVIFAPAQYRAAIAENVLFSQFMESLFFSRTLLFIGASLAGIEDYLSGLKFRGMDTAPRQHYVLVDVLGSAWQVKAEILKRRYNITVLPYKASRDYPEVIDFLELLSKKIQYAKAGVPISSAVGQPPPRPNSWLSRVHLENIGPFDKQSFDLNPQWNVLLGDNGVGKSSILKALAIGICGEDTKPYADRLIKAGMPSGTITLEITSQVADGEKIIRAYTTKILRTEVGAEIQTIPTRPLEAENLFALAFPPLRYLSWEHDAESPSSGKERPVSADLLPMIMGEPDPRLDRLRSWMIELDHQIQSDKNDGRTETRYTKLRDKFFEVIKELTPGLKVEFKRFDLRTKKVIVTTDDGEVPLESISQGTSSLLGWIGVLLRRLYDVYGDQYETYGEQYDPLRQRAIVLIDEIDAHMHPEWQRLLAPQIRKLFPQAQLIATTHSPLIIPSLKIGEVISLRRDNTEARRIQVEIPDYDVQGFRTDQVLTSPLFNLPTSLSPDKEEKLIRYTELAARSESLSDPQEKELKQLADEFNIKLPSPEERPITREAYEMVKEGLEKRLDEMDPHKKAQILDEMKVQFQEIFTGTGRP
jgi:predicted ATP-binding protein involved in virulence